MNLITISTQHGDLTTEVRDYRESEILAGVLKMLCIINTEAHTKLVTHAASINYSLIDIPTLALYDEMGKFTSSLEVRYSKMI